MDGRSIEEDIRSCITQEELADLFDNAFATWKASPPDGEGPRQTPRIDVCDAKPLFATSYLYQRREVFLTERAAIANVSADGLAVELDQGLPVGATLRFAFESRDGERHFGEARVARSTNQGEGFRIGLSFASEAGALDVRPSVSSDDAARSEVTTRAGRLPIVRWRSAVAIGCRVLSRRKNMGRRRLELPVGADKGVFVVEAGLFRYSAALFVNGIKVMLRTGALNDRVRNLYSDNAAGTMVHLEASDFLAWATLRANLVTDCALDLTLERKHRRCMRVIEGTSAATDDSQSRRKDPLRPDRMTSSHTGQAVA